jgi:hypothetical protein
MGQLTSPDCRSKNVIVEPIVVAELDLGKRHKG